MLPDSSLPGGLTESQVAWLSWRMGCSTDEEACALTHLGGAPVDIEAVRDWHLEPAFAIIYSKALEDKRDGFRMLSSQLLGKGVRVLSDLLDSEKEKTRLQALTLLLRSQGLLIDKIQTASPEALAELIATLRSPRPVITVLSAPPGVEGAEPPNAS